MTDRPVTNSGILITAENGAQVDTVGVIVLGIAFLIVLVAYMRVQGRYRRLLESLAGAER